MANLRQIYRLDAVQVIVSDAHPEGLLSNVPNTATTIDSRNYGATEENPNGNSDTALIVAQARYADTVETLATANNAARVMWTVTLTQANGVQIMRKSWGAFPDMTPAPEPEEEPVEE